MKSALPINLYEGVHGVERAQAADAVVAPHIVIRGETITTPPHIYDKTLNKLSFVDYLSFTYRPETPIKDEFPLKDVLVDIFNIPYYCWRKTKTGWQGYTDHIKLDFYGEVGFGGESQNNTIHVAINGTGCAEVKDWLLVYDWLVTTSSTLSRVDLAHDDYKGTIVNIAQALKWEKEKQYHFTGRPPETHLRDDRGSNKGCTFYIGYRENPKYGRIYEKGKKAGDKSSPWCRAEVEFKKAGRTLPYEMLIESDKYLAGAYKAFSYLSKEQSRIKTTKQEKQIALSKATSWCLMACGQFINLLCIINDEDTEKVIKMLRRPGIPKKLEPFYKQYLLKKGITP